MMAYDVCTQISWGARGEHGSPETEIIGSCKLSNMGVERQTWVLWKKGKHYQLLKV